MDKSIIAVIIWLAWCIFVSIFYLSQIDRSKKKK